MNPFQIILNDPFFIRLKLWAVAEMPLLSYFIKHDRNNYNMITRVIY